jgi:hypothetical protein
MKIARYLLPTLIAISACTQKGADAPRSDTAPPTQTKLNIETLATGLEFPWGIPFCLTVRRW